MESQAPLLIRPAAAEIVSVHFTPGGAKNTAAVKNSQDSSCWCEPALSSLVFASPAVEPLMCTCLHVCLWRYVCLLAFYLGDIGGRLHMCACLNVKPAKAYIYLLWQTCVSYSSECDTPGASENRRGAEASSSSSLYYSWTPMVLLPWRSSKTAMQRPPRCCSNTITVFQHHLGLRVEIVRTLRIAFWVLLSSLWNKMLLIKRCKNWVFYFIFHDNAHLWNPGSAAIQSLLNITRGLKKK